MKLSCKSKKTTTTKTRYWPALVAICFFSVRLQVEIPIVQLREIDQENEKELIRGQCLVNHSEPCFDAKHIQIMKQHT